MLNLPTAEKYKSSACITMNAIYVYTYFTRDSTENV